MALISGLRYSAWIGTGKKEAIANDTRLVYASPVICPDTPAVN